MTTGKYKATAAVAVLYGFKPWLLFQGKRSVWEHSVQENV
jgi:hypothetical protein